MYNLEKCPICKDRNFHVLKYNQFESSGLEKYKELIDDYVYSRLSILFNNICKDKKQIKFYVILCKSCGLIFTNPRFSDEDIEIKYDAIGKLNSLKKSKNNQPVISISKTANLYSKHVFSLISKFQKNAKPKRKILDYGGAQGYNLIPFIKEDNSCYLIDYVKSDYPEGIKYLGKNIDNLKQDDFFDVILLCHTLEHVVEPQRMINELSSHLAKEGLLYVQVPLGCWREWKKLKEPLTHVNFFSEQPLFKCLRKASLNIVYLSTEYQWVTSGKKWCINIVGCNQEGNTIRKFKRYHKQIENPYYYIKSLINNPLSYLNRIKNMIF